MCAAIIDTQDLEKIREELRPLRLPGQVKLHWTDERHSRRRKIVDTLSEIDSMQAIITHQSEVSKKTERHRRKCLEQMYFELSEMHVHNGTLESRQEAQNRRDVAHIVALQGQGQSAGIRLRHVRGGDDPLLWIPDAVLGALNSVHLGGRAVLGEAARESGPQPSHPGFPLEAGEDPGSSRPAGVPGSSSDPVVTGGNNTRVAPFGTIWHR